MSSSRHRTRQFLLQSLYSRIYENVSFTRDVFVSTYFENAPKIDEVYYENMERGIIEKQSELLGLISELAPKFTIKSMPTIHLVILMIALYEMLYYTGGDVSEKVSMNEAVELAKEFSDESGRAFINGVLSEFQKRK